MLPQLGESCEASFFCVEPAVCDTTINQCVAPPTAGQPCLNAGCAEPLYCDVDLAVPTCMARPPLGQACTVSYGCEDGATCLCDDTACTTRSCRTMREPGESCTGPHERCIPDATRCEGGVCVDACQGLFEKACNP